MLCKGPEGQDHLLLKNEMVSQVISPENCGLHYLPRGIQYQIYQQMPTCRQRTKETRATMLLRVTGAMSRKQNERPAAYATWSVSTRRRALEGTANSILRNACREHGIPCG